MKNVVSLFNNQFRYVGQYLYIYTSLQDTLLKWLLAFAFMLMIIAEQNGKNQRNILIS